MALETKCCYADCYLCCISFMLCDASKPFKLSVIMLNVIMLSVIMLNVVMLSVIMLNVVMLSVILLNVVMLNVIMPIVVVPNGEFLKLSS
jgi:hypothetical protein